jgi:hypothetical protein
MYNQKEPEVFKMINLSYVGLPYPDTFTSFCAIIGILVLLIIIYLCIKEK